MIPMVTFRLRDFSDDIRCAYVCEYAYGPWAAKPGPGFDLRLFRVMEVRFCKV